LTQNQLILLTAVHVSHWTKRDHNYLLINGLYFQQKRPSGKKSPRIATRLR